MTSRVGPAEIYADAKGLWSFAMTPARSRAVVSRAYYAAFHAVRDAASEKGVSTIQTTGGMHKQLLESLRQSSDDLMRQVGKRLSKVYDRRISADYQLGQPVTADSAKMALEDAEEIIFDLLGVEEPKAASSSDQSA